MIAAVTATQVGTRVKVAAATSATAMTTNALNRVALRNYRGGQLSGPFMRGHAFSPQATVAASDPPKIMRPIGEPWNSVGSQVKVQRASKTVTSFMDAHSGSLRTKTHAATSAV